jgi:hypothetical protein
VVQLGARDERRTLSEQRARLHMRTATLELRRQHRRQEEAAAAAAAAHGIHSSSSLLSSLSSLSSSWTDQQDAEEQAGVDALAAELAATEQRLQGLVHTWTRWHLNSRLVMRQLREQRSRWRAQPGAVAAAKLATPALVGAIFEEAGRWIGQLPARKVAHLLWAAPWLGFRPDAAWGAAAVARAAACAGELSLMDSCMLLWAAARMQQDLALPPQLLERLVERTRRLLLAAAAAPRQAAAAAAAAAPSAAHPAETAAAAAAPQPMAGGRRPAPRPSWPPPGVAADTPQQQQQLPVDQFSSSSAPGCGFRYNPAAAPRRLPLQPASPAAAAPAAAAAAVVVMTPQDAVMLPWAFAVLEAAPTPEWAAAFCGAARRVLPLMSGLQLGIMLRMLAGLRLVVPAAFLEAAETRALVNSAVWEPGACALVNASVLQLRQLRAAEAAAVAAGVAPGGGGAAAAAAARRGRERSRRSRSVGVGADGLTDGSGDLDRDLDLEDEAAAAREAAESEWELLASLGITPLSVAGDAGAGMGDGGAGPPLVTHSIRGVREYRRDDGAGWRRVPSGGR